MKSLFSLAILFSLLHTLIFTALDIKEIAHPEKDHPRIEQAAFSGAVDVSVGRWHACTATTDGEVLCWGANWAGQLGDGSWSESLTPTKVSGLSDVTRIVSGERHTCALNSSGGLKCWGFNVDGQLGAGTMDWGRNTPQDVVGLSSGVTSISAGFWHTCAVIGTGGVKCWGINDSGQLGDGTYSKSSSPVDVSGLSGEVSALAAGLDHTCALITTGAVECWGRNWAGQLGDGSFNDSLTPVAVDGLSSGVTLLGAGEWHTCASTGSGAKCWGRNEQGQVGDGTGDIYLHRPVPVDVNSLPDDITSIDGGKDFSCVVNDLGVVKCWGRNSEGQLGDGTRIESTAPITPTNLADGVIRISSKWKNTCAVEANGAVKCWGMNDSGQAGNNTISRQLTPGEPVNFGGTAVDLSAAANRSCLIGNDDLAYCWGLNEWGELGDGSRDNQSAPTAVGDLTGVQAISNGNEHSCVLNLLDDVHCWGLGWAGQLGDGSSGHTYTPVTVTNIVTNVLQIDAGWDHNCAVLSGDTLKCWGMNDVGQLGDGTTDWSADPVEITGLDTGVVSVVGGHRHTCAVLTNESAKCWGNNESGQLGDGSVISSTVPVTVTGLINVSALSLGMDHTCALNSTGGVKCWGSNYYGQLGDDSGTDQSSPVDVVDLTSGVQQIAVGHNHSCALLLTGEVKCWGFNFFGQLGDSTVNHSAIPVDVTGLASAGQKIQAGEDHTCVWLDSGAIQCWGSNGYGQLGLGDLPWNTTPTGVLFHSINLPIVLR